MPIQKSTAKNFVAVDSEMTAIVESFWLFLFFSFWMFTVVAVKIKTVERDLHP